jgi:hypothetical protein
MGRLQGHRRLGGRDAPDPDGLPAARTRPAADGCAGGFHRETERLDRLPGNRGLEGVLQVCREREDPPGQRRRKPLPAPPVEKAAQGIDRIGNRRPAQGTDAVHALVDVRPGDSRTGLRLRPAALRTARAETGATSPRRRLRHGDRQRLQGTRCPRRDQGS